MIDSETSMGSSFESNAVWLGHVANYNIQLVFTGTPEGVFELQGSNDKGNEDRVLGGWDDAGVFNWTDIQDSDQAISGAGTHVWDVMQCGYRWVRVIYSRSTSTGTLISATFNAKGV